MPRPTIGTVARTPSPGTLATDHDLDVEIGAASNLLVAGLTLVGGSVSDPVTAVVLDPAGAAVAGAVHGFVNGSGVALAVAYFDAADIQQLGGAGSYILRFTTGSTFRAGGITVPFEGASQDAPAIQLDGGASPVSVTLGGVADESMAIDFLVTRDATTSTAQNGQTSLTSGLLFSTNYRHLASFLEAAAGDVTLSYTHNSASNHAAYAGLAVLGGGGGAGGTGRMNAAAASARRRR